MDLLNLMIDPGADVYYSDAFRVVMEDHMTYLRNHEDNQALVTQPVYAQKYQGDFFGLLQHHHVAAHLHWVTLRMNHMTNPTQYDGLGLNFIIPSARTLEVIRNTYKTQSKIKR